MTICHQKGTANIGLVSLPAKLNSVAVNIVPKTTPATILHEAIFVYNKMASPINIATTDVSPIDPGIKPKKASLHV